MVKEAIEASANGAALAFTSNVAPNSPASKLYRPVGPDGKTLYFISSRAGFLNVWGIRFDPDNGQPVGQPFQVTAFENPAQMTYLQDLVGLEMSLAEDRLVVPIMQVSGNIWVLENVDR